MGKAFVLVLGFRELVQELTNRHIARGIRGPAIKACGLDLHRLGKVADLIKTKRTHEPKRLVVDGALDILALDQRQILAELRSMEIEQHAAMPCFLVRHLIEDLGGGGIVLAQSLCEAAVDAAVLFPHWR
jgi:hypothetical protein